MSINLSDLEQHDFGRQITFWKDFVDTDLNKNTIGVVWMQSLTSRLNRFIYERESPDGSRCIPSFWDQQENYGLYPEWTLEQLKFCQAQAKTLFNHAARYSALLTGIGEFVLPLQPATLRYVWSDGLKKLFTGTNTDCFLFKLFSLAESREFRSLVRVCPTCGNVFIRKGKQKFDRRGCAVGAAVKADRERKKAKQITKTKKEK